MSTDEYYANIHTLNTSNTSMSRTTIPRRGPTQCVQGLPTSQAEPPINPFNLDDAHTSSIDLSHPELHS
eukprot:3084832-Amphidinium_carterae.1